MTKSKGIVLGIVFLLALMMFAVPGKYSHPAHINRNFVDNSIDRMPIIQERNPLLARINNGYPVENRSREYIKWLQSSFKISVGGGSGSGTLCYYEPSSNTAYIISCGHLWSGNMRANQSNVWANVITWYHNEKKLPAPRSYPAKVVFYSNDAGYDCSLLAFRPDWIPQIYYPIARAKQFKRGERFHSVGCDHGEEVADYVVELIDIAPDPRGGLALVTQYNSPRPGRSGGGLMDQNGYFLGICWATSRKDGTGTGYFTPLEAIQAVYTREGYGFLLNQPLPGLARKIPILDHNKPGRRFREDYIILPNS